MTEAAVDVAATTSAKRPSESTERSVVPRESNAEHAYVLPPNPNPYETPPLGPVAAPPPPVVPMITSAHTNAEAGPTGDQPDSAHTGYALAVVPAAAPLLVPHALPRPADTTATATTATAAVAASASVSAPRSPHPNASAMPPASARAQPMPSSPAKALIGTRQMVTARDFPNGEYTGSTKIVAIDAAGQAMHVREGTGKLRYRNGNWYEGDWAGDKAEGRGRFCWAKSGSTYEGDWRDDQKHGTGTYVYHNSKEKYAGEWKRDRKHGKGEYVYASGSKYTGDFVDGVAEGRGEYVYHTGDRYVGEWKRDKPNGKGCFFYANGTRFEGTFVDDRKTGTQTRRLGWLSLTAHLAQDPANGTVHDGNWIDGVKTGVCRVSDPDRRQHYIEEWFEGNLLERKVVPAEPQQAVASRS